MANIQLWELLTSLFPYGSCRRFVQPRDALLSNHLRPVRNCLLDQSHRVGSGFVNVSQRIVLVLAEIGSDGSSGSRAHQIVVDCSAVQDTVG
jgi:hypothetical protein